jgi:RNA polymerase sigma-70 factor (ECF subfamily)
MAEEKVASQFVELFVRHQRAVYGYIQTIVPNVNEADEIFQETSLVLWKKRDDYDSTLEFLPWACGIARKVAGNHWAKNGRDRHSFSFSDSFLEQLATVRASRSEWLEAAMTALHDCLARLRDDQRLLLQMRYNNRNSIDQVAQQMNCSSNTVYQRLHRIRQRLYDCVRYGMRKEASP